jgi:hypothetical protein
MSGAPAARFAPAAAVLTACVLLTLALSSTEASPGELESLYGRHFVARFHEANRVHAEAAVEEADNLAERLQDSLGVKLDQRAEIVICPTHEEFEKTVGQSQGGWVVGIAQPGLNRVVLKQGSVKGMRRVTRHEVVHLLVAKALGKTADRAPRWLQEGAAKYYGDDWSPGDREVLADALKAGRLHSLDELAEFPTRPDEAAVAYAESYILVQYLASLDPPHGLSRFIVDFRETGEVDRALLRAYGLSQAQVEAGWREAIEVNTRTAPGDWAVETSIFLLLVLAFLAAYVRVRRRSREIRERMEQDELLDRLSDAAARSPEPLPRPPSPPPSGEEPGDE